MNNQFVPRVTPAEALKFSGQEGEFIDIGRKAAEIAQYCEVFFLNHYSDGDPLFRHFCTMQAVSFLERRPFYGNHTHHAPAYRKGAH